MEKEALIKAIEQNDFETEELLIEREKEIALKIMECLQGTLVIRATSILKFCLKAVRYTKINS